MDIMRPPRPRRGLLGLFTTLALVWGVLSVLVYLSILGGLGYVAWHFIKKFW